jgi:hypothetical protein
MAWPRSGLSGPSNVAALRLVRIADSWVERTCFATKKLDLAVLYKLSLLVTYERRFKRKVYETYVNKRTASQPEDWCGVWAIFALISRWGRADLR